MAKALGKLTDSPNTIRAAKEPASQLAESPVSRPKTPHAVLLAPNQTDIPEALPIAEIEGADMLSDLGHQNIAIAHRATSSQTVSM